MDGAEGSTVIMHELSDAIARRASGGGGVDLESENDPKRGSSVSHLPSPPLTRVGTRESGWQAQEAEDSECVVRVDPMGTAEEGVDVGDSGMGPGVAVEESGASDVGVVDSSAEIPSPSATRRRSALNVSIHPPPSPQPWELIDPPESDEEGNRVQRYRTVGESKRFDVMQKQSPPRPLIPKSAYYFGPPAPDAAYGSQPIGQIGRHHPREILRVERDYSGGEIIQFAPIYPMELVGRITPTQFLESLNAINELLISAHSWRHTFLDNFLAVFTLQLSPLFLDTHYEKEMNRLKLLFQYLNEELYNPVGLNMLWPQKVGFLFLEIEYY